MNAANLSKTLQTRRQFFHRPSGKKLGTMIKQPLVQTPEKYRDFDADSLMKMDLIPTPPSIKHLCREPAMAPDPFELTMDSSTKFTMITKMSIRDRMICHQDFPQLLHLLHKVKTGCVCSKDYTASTVKLMKDQSKLPNFVIYRGQCKFTDYQMKYYRSMLLNNMKMTARALAIKKSRGPSLPPLLSPIEEKSRGKMMTTSDLIDWADTYVTTSKPDLKQDTPALQKKRCGSKIAAMKKTMNQKTKAANKKQGVPKKPSKTAPGPFRDFSSLKRDAHAHISQSIATPGKATIASDVAITTSPHPFKKSKTYGSPPSRVIAKRPEVLSDITTRSRKGAGPNDPGAAPQAQPGSPSSMSSPIAKFSLAKIQEDATLNDYEKSLAIMKENHTPPVEEASQSTKEPTQSSEAKTSVDKKESENTVPPILSFSFA